MPHDLPRWARPPRHRALARRSWHASVAGCGLRGWRRSSRHRQHLVARGGDQYRMLPLRRQTVVFGDHGPSIRKLTHLGPAGVDHRLDGKDHARFEPHSGARTAVVQHLRLLVEAPADAMTAELTYDGKAGAL